jgi:hypothetical protein
MELQSSAGGGTCVIMRGPKCFIGGNYMEVLSVWTLDVSGSPFAGTTPEAVNDVVILCSAL